MQTSGDVFAAAQMRLELGLDGRLRNDRLQHLSPLFHFASTLKPSVGRTGSSNSMLIWSDENVGAGWESSYGVAISAQIAVFYVCFEACASGPYTQGG